MLLMTPKRCKIRGALFFVWLVCISSLHLGCATGYQPISSSGGYSVDQLSNDSFTVRFVGNYSASRERVRDLARLRACETCIQHGFRYFSVLEDFSGEHSVFPPFGIRNLFRVLRIQCFNDRPATAECLDAESNQQMVRQKYGLN